MAIPARPGPRRSTVQKKWGPASLPAPTAPSEGSAKPQNKVPGEPDLEPRLTSSGVAFHRPLPRKRSLAASTPVRQPKPRFCFAPPGLTEVKADRCSAALLGMIVNCVPLCLPRPEDRWKPRRAVERSSLPAPRPGWPRFSSRKSLHIACRGDRTFSRLPHRPAVSGSSLRPGPPSRSQVRH